MFVHIRIQSGFKMQFSMGTIAVSFTGKIKNLTDHYMRLLNGTIPQPSSSDIISTLTSLIQTLQSVLKEVPSHILPMVKYEQDDVRLRLLPSMDYWGLYKSLILMLDVFPLVHNGLEDICISYFNCLGYLMPFLESDSLNSLPFHVAVSLSIFPIEVHEHIITYLIYYVLPFTVSRYDNDIDDKLNISAIVMLVFQYSENFSYHRIFLETLMALKQDIEKDLLCVTAYGTTSARLAAVRLFLCYWPTFSTALYERKSGVSDNILHLYCQCKTCPHPPSNVSIASKVCYDLYVSIKYTSGNPPPLYLCIECANEIHNQYGDHEFYDILHSVQLDSLFCENKNCRSKITNKNIMSLCFSMECAAYNGNHPIHYCEQCHHLRHNSRHGSDHIFHTCLPNAWDMELPMRTYWMESIISLMKESRPSTPEIPKDLTDLQSKTAIFNVQLETSLISTEERQFMGRFGVWLLIGLCKPEKRILEHIIGRLLSMLFHWFHVTAYCYDEQAEVTLEELKSEHICKWLQEINTTHFSVFVSCLLPHPKYHSRVGGHWDMLLPATLHLKTGINRLLSLIPYDLMTHEVWNVIMPPWLEAISNQVPSKELYQFKMLISKILDPDMNSLGFDAKKLYHFITSRCKTSVPELQIQALSWIQVLTVLEIAIPVHILFSTFEDAVDSLSNDGDNTADFLSCSFTIEQKNALNWAAMEDVLPNDMKKRHRLKNFTSDEFKLCCCILMLDCILKQMKLHNATTYLGTFTGMIQDISRLLKKTLSAPWFNHYTCTKEVKECFTCEIIFAWYQFSYLLIEYVVPAPVLPSYDSNSDSIVVDSNSKKTPVENDKKEFKSDSVNSPFMEINTIMTATVETVVEQLDLAPIILTERLIPAVARAATISDQFSSNSSKQPNYGIIPSSSIFFERYSIPNSSSPDSSYKTLSFNSDELPPQLQFLHELLKVLPNAKNSVILYFMLQSLYSSILHGNFLIKYAKNQQYFLSWCQENLIIKQMWILCNAEYSHICEICVPILLHCITLPSGSNIFCKVLKEDFNNPDWQVRFLAVERATVISRFVESISLQNNNSSLQEALSNTFCHLISSIDDSNKLIAQRATLFLGTIHDQAVKILMSCIESQFDSVIIDRTVVLQSLYQLHNTLSDRKILTWEFFINRFDTLHIESHLHFENIRDIQVFKELKNVDCSNEDFIKKLQKVQGTLFHTSESNLLKVLNSNFGSKWPFKRTISSSSLTSSENFCTDDYGEQTNTIGAHGRSTSNEQSTTLKQIDRETVHLLIFMLMEFMSKADDEVPADERHLSKIENTVINHLFLLLGFKRSENSFQITLDSIKSSPAFNAFITNLPQVLDQNCKIGKLILSSTLHILQFCPFPNSRSIQECQPNPLYSIWYLEPHIRKSWLNSLLVICYKYNCKKLPLSAHIIPLIKIVLNTLNAQLHLHCISPSLILPRESMYHTTENDTSSLENVGGEFFSKKLERKSTKLIRPDRSSTTNTTTHKLCKFASLENIYETRGDSTSNVDQFSPKGLNMNDICSTSMTPLASTKLLQKNRINQFNLENNNYFEGNNKKSGDSISLKNLDLQEMVVPAPERLLPIGTPVLKSRSSFVIDTECLEFEESNKKDDVYEKDLSKFEDKKKRETNERNNLRSKSSENILTDRKIKDHRLISRRRLTKQIALELPGMDDNSNNFKRKFDENSAIKKNNNVLIHELSDSIFLKILQNDGGKNLDVKLDFKNFCHSSSKLKQSSYRIDENCMYERCTTCGMVKEEYSDEELGLCLIILGTFVHREPSTASNLVPNILYIVSKFCNQPIYSWQTKSNLRLPGGLLQVASQFLRTILHQMAPSGIFILMFQMRIEKNVSIQFFRTVIQALIDFKELCPVRVLIVLLELMINKKSLPVNKLNLMINNIANYLECLLTENVQIGSSLIIPLDTFSRKIAPCMEENLAVVDFPVYLHYISCILKISAISSFRSILEPFSKILSYGLQNFEINYDGLIRVCDLCHRAFPRDREKFTLTRVSMFQLSQTLKFKSIIPAPCFFSLLHLLLQDSNSSLFIYTSDNKFSTNSVGGGNLYTGAADVMRQYLIDAVEFIYDSYTSIKIKNIYKNPTLGLSEDMLGGTLKTAVSQYASLELSHASSRENRSLQRFLPWLSTTNQQQITKDVLECSNQARMLSWLMIGSLTNYCTTNTPCMPIPPDVSCYIIDHMQIILSNFAESGKVFSASSILVNCFILCQLWNMYLEHGLLIHRPNTEPHILTTGILVDFWSKITPFMLNLASKSEVMSDTISLHLVNILEMLIECRSPALSKLLPLWSPMTTSRIPGHIQMRLQNCHSSISSTYFQTSFSGNHHNMRSILLKWLHRIQFKLSQIELQDTQTSHFYSM